MMNLTKYEQETIINFNAGEKRNNIHYGFYVMRQLDSLAIEYPYTFRCIKETDISKTYEMPKKSVTYRKPRSLSEE